MKTAGRKTPNRWATVFSNRALGADGKNRSRFITWAAKQEKVQPLEMCFFLTSPFIELTRSLIHKIQGHAFVAVEKAYKPAKVGRCHIVVDRTEIAMIGDVQRVGSEAEVVFFPVFTF
jgi:hypothetical protein